MKRRRKLQPLAINPLVVDLSHHNDVADFGKVKASGDAYWAMSAESAKNGALHDGSFEDVGEVKDGAAHIGSPQDGMDCSVDVRLLSSHYLIAGNQGVGMGDDDKASGCWGANVTFEGLYVRVKK